MLSLNLIQHKNFQALGPDEYSPFNEAIRLSSTILIKEWNNLLANQQYLGL